MTDIMKIIEDFKGICSCGLEHKTAIRDLRIASGLVNRVGEILKENGFPKKLLLVADKNTLAASDGIVETLGDFEVEFKIYDYIRVATMEHVDELRQIIRGRDIGILSVGSGSVNDPCRLAAARENKMLCIFATAPSMDGFASYSSPIVANGFKESFPAKSPEVIIGDTKILAAAPVELKSAGFGDMVAKYTSIVDWKISKLLVGEKGDAYCDRVVELTLGAINKLMSMADRVTANDEETAGEILSALLMTGIGMSFMQNSRPASGAEHIISHLIECVELKDGIIPNFHGEDIGVCTLITLDIYNRLAQNKKITAAADSTDWKAVYDYYGELADDVKRLNEPKTCTDPIELCELENKWPQICDIIHSVPSYDECREAMKKAGCKLTVSDIGKSEKLVNNCIKYSPYMRDRLTLLRIISGNMIKEKLNVRKDKAHCLRP